MFSKQNKIGLGGIGLGCFSFLCGKYELPTDWKAQEYIEGQTNIGLGGIVFGVYLHLCGGKCEFPSAGNLLSFLSDSTMERSQMFVPQQSCHRQPVKLDKNGTLFSQYPSTQAKRCVVPCSMGMTVEMMRGLALAYF